MERYLQMANDLRVRVYDLQDQAQLAEAEADWHERHGTLDDLRGAVRRAQTLRRESFDMLRRLVAEAEAEESLPLKSWDWDSVMGIVRIEFCEPFEGDRF